MADNMSITMHVIGWNKKGVIGFMQGGGYLTYLGIPKEKEVIENIKKIYPFISDKTLKEVNKAQKGDSQDLQTL